MIKTLIVDDEVHAQEYLASLLEQYGDDKFQLIGTCGSVDEAIPVITKKKPDLVFMDIQMPGKTGIELFETIKDPDFSVVFTTAHKDYAIETINKVRPFDYLLKPIIGSNFKACLEKFLDFVEPKKEDQIKNENILSIHMENQIHFVQTKEILYLKANGSYTEVHREGHEPLLASKNLGQLLEKLSPKDFLRIHNKFVVNINKVVTWDRQDHFLKLINGEEISVAYRKSNELRRMM
ncbi:two-component system response regulatory protein [Nitritalea halalkaliphila LW7]|uniref:Two-component system response regulatory protein n=1 Tax=Nitritalea halalkaliphila LW7 TaxID=1189621 RepID=I5C1W6_9BACT|nr:LytTR family DNA-binding domain-containing protein [Nitritalea halalkaliphila]EIM75818.1 two-component system response regulatory protein [Nitritalea halalkaliphila LW7]